MVTYDVDFMPIINIKIDNMTITLYSFKKGLKMVYSVSSYRGDNLL